MENEITIDRLTKDLGELIDVLLVEFEQEKVLLVAHSWGTVLAIEHAAAKPETVAAYIAISQTTSQAESDAEGYKWALARAKESKDVEAIKRLADIGLPPYTIDVPIVMVMGRHDRVISPTLGAQYFEMLKAPAKELIWFENSAHGPPFEEPEKFNEVVRKTAQGVDLIK